MTRDQLLLPDSAVDRLIDEIKVFGVEDLETGAFLLAPATAPDRIRVVALAGHQGITRRPDQFIVAGAALERLFGWAEDHQLRVRAQLHSHRGPAFLSHTDRSHGLNVPGFLATIVPCFAAPPRTPSAWGWWRYDSIWRPTAPSASNAQPASIVRFDEGGVRAA